MIVWFSNVQVHVTSGEDVALCLQLLAGLDQLATDKQRVKAQQTWLASMLNGATVGGRQ